MEDAMCRYCDLGEPLPLNHEGVVRDAVIEYNRLIINGLREGFPCEVGDVEIDFCPICGKYLGSRSLRRYVRPSVDDRSRE